MARPNLTPGAPSLRLNAFPLILPPGSTLPYRIWAVDPVPRTPRTREKIRGALRWTLLRRPVAQRYVGDKFVYAVAEGGSLEPVDYVGDGAIRYRIGPTDDLREIALDGLDGTGDLAETELAAALLQQELIRHVNRDPTLASGYRGDEFFNLTPSAAYPGPGRPGGVPARPDARATVDIFRGFTFRVVPVAGVGLCVVLDVQTAYIGHRSLADYLANGGLPRHVDEGWGGGRWVNDYGTTKQSVYLLEVSDRTIGEVTRGDERSTYDYLCERYPQVRDRIAPGDRAATIMYRPRDERDEERHYPAATTLLRPKFGIGSSEVRARGDTAAFPPDERARRIDADLGHLSGARFGGGRLVLAPALRRPQTVLPLPDLVFGPPEGPTTLRGGERIPGDAEARRKWGGRKMDALRRHGPRRRAAFDNPYLVYPAGLERDSLLDDFLARTAQFSDTHGRAPFAPEADPYRDGAPARDIISKVQGLAVAGRAGFILLGLPPDPARAAQVYAGVKSQVRLPIKCFSAAKLRDEVRRGRLPMYADRNALGMLVENGARPWGLAAPLAYEMQIGLDVARYKQGGLLGAAVIGAPDGTDILFHHKEIDRREQIPANIVGPLLRGELERFFKAHGRAPHGILFQRDGRLFDVELKGIRNALKKFAEVHPTEPHPAWVAVSVEKRTAAPLRLIREERGRLDRAFSGSYFVQHPTVAYLVLAGGPGLRQGTPRPIRVEVVDASEDCPDLLPILGDIFSLSQLNWGAPEIDISLPITLRFTDQKLERYATGAATRGTTRASRRSWWWRRPTRRRSALPRPSAPPRSDGSRSCRCC
jgi:hypothetical protein